MGPEAVQGRSALEPREALGSARRASTRRGRATPAPMPMHAWKPCGRTATSLPYHIRGGELVIPARMALRLRELRVEAAAAARRELAEDIHPQIARPSEVHGPPGAVAEEADDRRRRPTCVIVGRVR